ncbi:hypothetical protein ACTSKR_09865 [Chitinibacteraceae bacterium HSL-7]
MHPQIARVLDQARILHRTAQHGAHCDALPVLRRLLSSGALASQPLPRLFEKRLELQRKHVLRLLAREAGYAEWAFYRAALLAGHAEALEPTMSTLNHWFASHAEAERHLAIHGGTIRRHGAHAMVTP